MAQAITMRMRESVLYAEAKISDLQGDRGFFVDTEFGRAGIEINPSRDSNPLHPVEVLPWQEAPDTVWARENAEENADFYVALDIYYTRMLDHMAVIEAFTRCMFLYFKIKDVKDAIIQAAINIYIEHYDCGKVTINSLMHEYLNVHIGWLIKEKPSVQVVVRELIQTKFDYANDIIERSKESLKRSGKTTMNFYDEYCCQLFGLVLYVSEDNLALIEQYNLQERK